MTEANPLWLYNSLAREKQQFIPADPKRVTMYNCGPTVYSYAHIGNARAAVVADVLFRVLRHIYGEDHVVYARNITDVDDKIIASGKEQGVDISEITEKYARIYNEDLAAIGCLMPTEQPKATDNIDEMQDIIVELMDKNIAYHSEGHILFDVTRMDEYAKEKNLQTRYGKLSGRKLDDNLAGARVEVASYKRNPGDFILWKPAKDDEPGWDFRNYGRGRPGWHIECSAMIRNTLGETIDIHCGGIDLKFPHHENEIAQSHCANDKPLAKFWIHNEFLNMGSEKMSKSLGNVTLIKDLLEKWDGEVIRLALLKADYRSELFWSDDLLNESKAQLDGWYRLLKETSMHIVSAAEENEFLTELIMVHPPSTLLPRDRDLKLALYNDIHSVIYISELSSIADEAKHNFAFFKHYKSQNKSIGYFRGFLAARTILRHYANLLGLLQKDPDEWFRGGLDYDALVAEYDSVRAQALAAKEAGDKAAMGQMFARSDELRDQFKSEGIIVETADGKSSWRKA